MERRFIELRQDGRLLTGTAVRYGDVARLPWGDERFTAGAFAPLGDVILNSMHDRRTPLARTGGGGLELVDSDSELRIAAELPKTQAADDALELVRTRVMRGLSIEFEATTERLVNGVRVIDRAVLHGVGLVDTPAYEKSEVEARKAALAVNRAAPVRRRVWL